jgi:hypothetical protein
MTRARTFTIAAIVLISSRAIAAPLVTYESSCECRDNHGKQRWAEKNDPAVPPADASAIQAVIPSDIFNWQGPTEHLAASSERIAAEQKWYALTGRVIELRAEEDGDLHILPLRMRTATSRARGLSNRCSSDHGSAGEGTGEVTAGSSGGGTDSSGGGADSSGGGADSSGGGTDSSSVGTNSSGVDAGEVTAGDSCSVGTGEMAASGFAGAAGGGE